MNGVELPCGSVLTVEPAYGENSRLHGRALGNDLPQHEAEERKTGVDDNEDLDDFFNSL
jgi:hypothetical protein